jgi:DtxR family transcriptional regulator, Mn-dependent transcriptional regulator
MENETSDITLVKPKEGELTETTENYLKRILWLSGEHGSAKVSDIAELMDRSLSSTSEAMKRLKDQGFIDYEKYGGITLTKKGRDIAMKINDAYIVLGSFLELIGLPQSIAHEDACSMEHSITNETVSVIRKFVQFIKEDPVNKAVIEKFTKINDQNDIAK